MKDHIVITLPKGSIVKRRPARSTLPFKEVELKTNVTIRNSDHLRNIGDSGVFKVGGSVYLVTWTMIKRYLGGLSV